MQTNEPDQPLWEVQRGFLPAATFARLQRELLETSPIMLPEHFAEGYNAVNINYNTDGECSSCGCSLSFTKHASSRSKCMQLRQVTIYSN